MIQFKRAVKAIGALYFLFIGIAAYAQELKEKQLRTLSNLGLAHQNFHLTKPVYKHRFFYDLMLTFFRRLMTKV